jgi:hypothetical protein
VLVCYERKVLLDGCWWLICSEKKNTVDWWLISQANMAIVQLRPITITGSG